MKPAIVLLSGGLDSTTSLALAQSQGYAVHALTINYGQRNCVEILAAQRVVQHFSAREHKIFDLNLRVFGGSSLTDEISVPAHEAQDHAKEVPNTYVPARNTIMLSLALAYAEVRGAKDIFFSANIHDYSGYPDCRPAYIEAYQSMANLAINDQGSTGLTIHAPLVNMSKAQIIQTGLKLGVKYEMTHSCYDPIADLACGQCSACFYRRRGFLEAGVADPTRYGHSPSPSRASEASVAVQ